MTASPYTDALELQLIDWLEARPRTYRETMETWGTHCPRESIWEDCVSAGLVEIAGRRVRATARGRARLKQGGAVQ